MAAFVEAGDLDDPSIGFVHVAGTNGKGSTTAYLQSLMVEGGYRTGAYFSPYVVDPRERVQLGRELISQEEFAQGTEQLRPIAERFVQTEFGGISEFEFKTALGLWAWKRHRCEWVALEVGLGGRWDATNVVSTRASIVVSIGWDHMHLLGDSLEKIAGEKAGIIKPGTPVILGSLPPETLPVFEAAAEERGAPVWRYGRDVVWEDGRVCTPGATYTGLRHGIAGSMQGHNLALAVAALEAAGCKLDEGAIHRGAERAYIPGRFQTVKALGTTFLLDGAHNVDAARVLAVSLQEGFPHRRVVLATNMIRGHDPEPFYRELLPLVERACVLPIDFPRALAPEETADRLRLLGVKTTVGSTVEEGLRAAAESAGPEGLVVVTGSFYLVGEALRSLPAAARQKN